MRHMLVCGIITGALILSSCAHYPVNESAIYVSVADVSQAAGGKIAVPISVDNITGNILGIDLQCAYSPGHLKFVNVGLGTLTGQWQVVVKESDGKDRVTIGLYGSRALLAQQGSIAVVNFSVKENAPAGATSALRLVRANFNEKSAVHIKNGKLTVLNPS